MVKAGDKMINWQEVAEKYTFVTFGDKYHILDEGYISCGKKPARMTIVRMPTDKSKICKICWRNRPHGDSR